MNAMPDPDGTRVHARIAFGQVRHARLRPRAHAFAYPNYFWVLPMRQLARQPEVAVARNRRAALSFHDRDHGDGGDDALAWLDALLRRAGADEPGLERGEVWLQTYPRVLGFAFKPVSFWWVHRPDGSLAAVVAEVNNTFGERHAYVMHGADVAMGRELTQPKVFHVSPFCAVQGRYRFRFMRSSASAARTLDGDRIVARIDLDDDDGPLLCTSQSGRLEPLTASSARRAFWGWPLMTWGVVARIHWQALRLWLKGVPIHTHPDRMNPTVSEPRS